MKLNEEAEVMRHKEALHILARLIARHMLISYSKQQKKQATTSDSKFDGVDVENETKFE